MTDDSLARAAYAAYGQATGGLNYQGLPMPEWDDLGEPIQRAWVAAVTAIAGGPVEEYGHLFGSGDVKVWDLSPELVEIYPLDKRIEYGKRHGGRVLRRRVIVVDEWEEI